MKKNERKTSKKSVRSVRSERSGVSPPNLGRDDGVQRGADKTDSKELLCSFVRGSAAVIRDEDWRP